MTTKLEISAGVGQGVLEWTWWWAVLQCVENGELGNFAATRCFRFLVSRPTLLYLNIRSASMVMMQQGTRGPQTINCQELADFKIGSDRALQTNCEEKQN